MATPVDLHLDCLALGAHTLSDVQIRGTVGGVPLGEGPVFMLMGGITASPYPFGDGEQPGWWSALQGPTRIDPGRHTVLCPAMPNDGTTWAGIDDGPRISADDMAVLVDRWLGHIGCTQPVCFIGASLGGMVGLALAARYPGRVRRLVSISAGARPDGWGTAVRHIQRQIVRHALDTGEDLAAAKSFARQIGMVTYRGRAEMNSRFGLLQAGQQHPDVASYLDHHGQKFARGFSHSTFLLLSEAIDRFRVSPEELSAIRCPVDVVSVESDLLFPAALQAELHAQLQAAGVETRLRAFDSAYGHDAFLADQDLLADVLDELCVFDDESAARISDYLDPAGCPAEPPPLRAMSDAARGLHQAIDSHAQRAGVAYLHPEDPTLLEDLLGGASVIAWQEGKAAGHLLGETCWSELPPLYARYGTGDTRDLIGAVRRLEAADAAVVVDSGMQATALLMDALIAPGDHAILCRQVYNKTRTYLSRLIERTGGSLTVVDDGDFGAIEAAIRPETALIFAETFTNPRLRVQDPARLAAIAARGRETAERLRLVIDDTIATPWGLKAPLLTHGVDVVVGSGTKALGGQDRDMWGYVASDDIRLMNGVMDLIALRGGILDWRRARAVRQGLEDADRLHARRCETAAAVAAFLASHPRVEEVCHPSLPDHPDAEVVAAHYARTGSLLSFRVRGASEDQTRHFCDVLAMTVVVRYALSFDGLVTKVNHHKSVSEYFTPPPLMRRNNISRLVRLGVGIEDAHDIVAALNWALWNAASVSAEAVAAWQAERAASLGA